jgi:hypothetical protein
MMVITTAAVVGRFVGPTELSAATFVEKKFVAEAVKGWHDKTTLTFCGETEDASLHATEVCEIHDEEEQAVLATLMDEVLWEQFKFVPQIDKMDEPEVGGHTHSQTLHATRHCSRNTKKL